MLGVNSISFKVFVVERGENVEIRKFEVDQGVVTNYDYIRERLQYTFPRLRGKIFQIMWKDAEGDEVTISSDEEVMIALSEMKTDIFKLIVHVVKDDKNESDNAFETFTVFGSGPSACPAMAEERKEPNLICNGCNKAINGYRYKCLECVNHEHCMECEKQGVHPEHVVIRLQKSHPTLVSLIPKFMHIFKQHVGKGCKQASFMPFLHEHFGARETEKEKFHGHRRRYRHCGKSAHRGNKPAEEPIYHEFTRDLLENVRAVAADFIDMFKEVPEATCEKETPQANKSSSSADNSGEDVQPETSAKATASATEMVVDEVDDKKPSASAPEEPKPNDRVAQGLQFLMDMGFNDEGKWMTRLLERFDGDVTRTLDHIMSQK